MYISVADSRAKGFMKWANTYQPVRRGDARAGADKDSVIAAADLDQRVITLAVQPHRPS